MATDSWAQAVDEQEAAAESVNVNLTRANVLLACLEDALACSTTMLTTTSGTYLFVIVKMLFKDTEGVE